MLLLRVLNIRHLVFKNDYFAKNWSEMGVEAYYDAS